MPLDIPISKRARKWGYVFWPKSKHEEVVSYLDGAKSLNVWIENSFIGKKNIDWKFHRFSIGPKQGRLIPADSKMFRITLRKDGSHRVAFI